MIGPGKVAFITGGSSGVGLGIAQACQERGLRIAWSYRTLAHRDQARRVLGQDSETVLAIPLEVTRPDSVARAVAQVQARWGGIDLLVNNAGIGVKTPASQATLADWQRVLGVNLMGVIHTISECLPGMRSRGAGGHIVTTASMSGLFPGGRSGLYTTSKFAVVGLMESLRVELAPQGIGVSIFCPGMTQSRIGDPDRVGDGEPCPGMDPLACGRQVLAGVDRNALYILTHPEFRPGLAERCQALLQSFPPAGPQQPWWSLEEPVLRCPIYSQALGSDSHSAEGEGAEPDLDEEPGCALPPPPREDG